MRILIPLETYEALCRRLTQHHKGHKGLSELLAVRSGLERNARIDLNGVEVDLNRLNIAADAIRDNVKYVGDRYGSAPDKTILLDIEEAILDHQAKLASPVPEAKPSTADALKHEPEQSLQQDDAQRVTALAALDEVATGQATLRPYVGNGRLAGRINGAVRGAPVQDEAAKALATQKANLGPPPEGTFWAWNGCDDFEAMPELRFAQID